MNPTIEVQTVELQRKTSLDLVKPKVLQPPRSNAHAWKMVAVNIKLGTDRYLLYISGSKSREDTTRVAFNTAAAP